jgi:hypothetical protein
MMSILRHQCSVLRHGGDVIDKGGNTMKGMRHKMMEKGCSPMDMMKNKHDQSGEEWTMPRDMCHDMISFFHEQADAIKFATPELRQLFNEWVEQIEQEIVQFVEKEGKVDPDAIARHFKLSKESVIFLLTRLAKQGKIRFATDKGGETS